MKYTINDIKIIMQEGEGQTIEFKEDYSPSIVKEIVAFANAVGGRIFIGIDDENKIKGIKVTNKLKSQITDMANNCDPGIHIEIQVVKNIVIVIVDEGANKPYQCREGFFLRQGPNSQKLSRDQIISLCMNENRIRFDTQVNTKFKYPKDFDNNTWKQYIEAIKISSKYKKEDILINLGVAQRAKGNILFNNAGILLFAKDPGRFIPSSYVDVVVFKGKERLDVIDRKTYSKGLYDNLSRTRIYLKEHLNAKYEYREDWKRINVYELPLDALREAVANALMHRDYSISGANISVAIFDDRVEIMSPGGLPKPLTVKDLGKATKRRNEKIADLFSRLEYVEKLGTGINKIRGWMKELGLKYPKIESNGFFTITFKRPVKENDGAKPLKFTTKKRLLKKVPERVTVKVPERVTVKVPERVTENQKKILNLISRDVYITIAKISSHISISERKTKTNISKLKSNGYLKRIGPDKGGHWEVVKHKT